MTHLLQVFTHCLSEMKPDIVNVHGKGDFSINCIRICQSLKIPCAYTEHLYISSHMIDKLDSSYKKDIAWIQSLYTISNLNIIAISTGMKTKIQEDYPSLKNIKVIKNGTDFDGTYISSHLREKYNLTDKKVLLCVGTLLARKNQKQLIRSFQLLDKTLQNDIRIIFCGVDALNGALQEFIKSNRLADKIYYAGDISPQDMKKFYSIASGLAMPSFAEGLSISALEAIKYGLPIIMFQDSECASDLNDEKICIYAKERTDESFADAIKRWYDGNWDSDYIRMYSKYFSMERVADEYIAYYKELIWRS